MTDKLIVELKPKIGLDNITFGMKREEVREIMENVYKCNDYTLRNEETDCYFENSLQFSFENDDTLSFIEVAAPPPVYVKLLGMNTWEISGEELLNKLKETDNVDTSLFEWESNPILQKNIITLYELDEQYDSFTNYTTPKWGAIGIGDERYYNAIKDINI